ncbi:C69 family dipeptidase [Alistipes sp. OttesenSCG-928-B03]|nr:C69 family dipeptidase [Alistipes sp. OttesenSCG-928-B03]
MRKLAILTAVLAILPFAKSEACTNFIITRGASTDGSVMVTYAADSHTLYGALYKYNRPAQPYGKGSMIPVYEWDSGRFLKNIPQVAQTWNTVGNVNEHQVMIGETTYGGRKELVDPDGKMDYGSMIYLTLQRAKTAREAIDIMVDLANTHGYASSGESFSVADKNEAWILEIIGKGSKLNKKGENVNKGIVWVARRIPDGYVSAHANHARITQFPMNDPENCIFSKDVISFAREMGYFNGKDEEFSFSDTYAPLDFSGMRGCEARVWAFFRTVADGMEKYEDYAMGHNPKNRMPLWVKPKAKISPKQVFDCMRDHYEGTPMDMTTDIGAGGEECPYRWRPMNFEVDGVTYVNERATATQQTGFWFVSQARNWLPDPVGCILWFGVDDAATSSLTPIYGSITDVPWCFSTENGDMVTYSPTSAFWLYNRVAQFAYLRYNVVGKYVRNEVDKWENARLAGIKAIDDEAAALYKESPEKAVRFLTDYSLRTAQEMFRTWEELDRYIMVRFKDGNNMKVDGDNRFIRDEWGMPVFPDQPGYTEKWKRAVIEDNGETLRQWDVK